MPEDRVQRLTDLGFEWTTKDPRKVPWETRFEGLKMFKERYGHVDVPHECKPCLIWFRKLEFNVSGVLTYSFSFVPEGEECPQLGFWTANMRQQFRYKQLGKKSSLTDERVELLNSIGFVWKMQGGRRKKSDPVARPNQSSSPSSSSSMSSSSMETASLVSPPGSAQKPAIPLVLDPMSSLSSGASSGTRSVPYYSNKVKI
jgi:hypothetical protein